jgi:hypothetical protein
MLIDRGLLNGQDEQALLFGAAACMVGRPCSSAVQVLVRRRRHGGVAPVPALVRPVAEQGGGAAGNMLIDRGLLNGQDEQALLFGAAAGGDTVRRRFRCW